jgi:hypothetical protein
MVTVDEVELLILPPRATDQFVPAGRPASENVTGNVVAVVGLKAIKTVWEAPFTVTVPEEGKALYPFTDPTVYAYPPSVSLKVMVLPVEVSVWAFSVTDHDVPPGRPVSVNHTR